MQMFVNAKRAEPTIYDMSATAIRDERAFETTMNALIIYDDNAIAAKTKAMLDRAACRAEEALLWSIKPWNFDLLLWPPTSDAAFEDRYRSWGIND
jgi:hypothetical protein